MLTDFNYTILPQVVFNKQNQGAPKGRLKPSIKTCVWDGFERELLYHNIYANIANNLEISKEAQPKFSTRNIENITKTIRYQNIFNSNKVYVIHIIFKTSTFYIYYQT